MVAARIAMSSPGCSAEELLAEDLVVSTPPNTGEYSVLRPSGASAEAPGTASGANPACGRPTLMLPVRLSPPTMPLEPGSFRLTGSGEVLPPPQPTIHADSTAVVSTVAASLLKFRCVISLLLRNSHAFLIEFSLQCS